MAATDPCRTEGDNDFLLLPVDLTFARELLVPAFGRPVNGSLNQKTHDALLGIVPFASFAVRLRPRW
jgi:hypothetical protein